MEPKKSKTEKKIYSQPKLFIYGDVREITRNTANAGAVQDGPGVGNLKTA